jgi:Ca2+-binding RTX toxin-like protein
MSPDHAHARRPADRTPARPGGACVRVRRDRSTAGATLSFVAADGETNNVTNSIVGPDFVIADGAGGLAAGAGCEGDDSLTSAAGNDALNGGAGADRLDGGAGTDTLNGDSSDDTLVGGGTANGNDTLNGGTGTDVADYAARTASLTISIDGAGNDGAPGKTDNVKTDVENVTAGSGNDALIGGTAANVLSGGAGHDSLDGDAANDTLDGGTGDDDLVGGAGTDMVTYSGRANPVTVVLDGGGGNGEAGEDDTIRLDVESVVGGSNGDGSPAAPTPRHSPAPRATTSSTAAAATTR